MTVPKNSRSKSPATKSTYNTRGNKNKAPVDITDFVRNLIYGLNPEIIGTTAEYIADSILPQNLSTKDMQSQLSSMKSNFASSEEIAQELSKINPENEEHGSLTTHAVFSILEFELALKK